MPEIEWNARFWDGDYDWTKRGEEWSVEYGGSEPQWFGSLYPRLHRFLPARAILEIAPGFGRWTRFLLPMCQQYMGIDLSGQCVESCKSSFGNVGHAQFLKNDGMSLDAAPDNTFDLVFSFDSLVHADAGVLDSYVPQILRKLAPRGIAFVHHSNAAAFPLVEEVPHGRSASVSAESVASAVCGAGGNVLVQEITTCAGDGMIDCLSLFCRRERGSETAAVRIWNPKFGVEAEIIGAMQAPYSRI
jgi:SAM-dependent methyltransferase